MVAPLIAVRCPGVVDKTIDGPESGLCSLNDSFPVVLSCDICFSKHHAVWHGLNRTLTAIFINVGHYYFGPLFGKQCCYACTIARATT